MKVFIGQAKVVGPISRYFGRFNFLEVAAEPGRCPRPSTLSQWRRSAPKGFAFAVRLGQSVGAFGTDSEKVIEFGLKAAEALESNWLVVQTPATLGPGQRNRTRLIQLFKRLVATGRRVAWDPRGVWTEEEVLPLISEADIHWARDPSRYPMVEEPVCYGRIPALGSAARVGLGLAERAGENLQGFEEVYLVIEGDGAGRAAQIIRDIAQLPVEDEEDAETDDGVEEISLGAGGSSSSEDEEFDEEEEESEDAEEDGEEEDLDDEEDADDEEEEEEASDEDEDFDDEEDLDEEEDADDEEEDETAEDDVAEEDKKPEKIDDSDLPWAPGAKKGRRSR